MTKTIPPETWVYLGKLGKTFGLKGGLHFYATGEAEGEALESLQREQQQLFIAGLGKRQLKEVQTRAKSYILFFAGVQHIDYARPLVNAGVYADPSYLPREDDLLYLDELINLPVFNEGQALGTVSDIIETGQQDTLVVEADTATYMLPLQADYVRVDDEGVHVENAPEGLFEV